MAEDAKPTAEELAELRRLADSVGDVCVHTGCPLGGWGELSTNIGLTEYMRRSQAGVLLRGGSVLTYNGTITLEHPYWRQYLGFAPKTETHYSSSANTMSEDATSSDGNASTGAKGISSDHHLVEG